MVKGYSVFFLKKLRKTWFLSVISQGFSIDVR